jgi:hypothetical protein
VGVSTFVATPGSEATETGKARFSPTDSTAGSEPPRWLLITAFGVAAAVLCAGTAGLVFAMLGQYNAPLAFATGAVGFIGAIALVVPALPHADATTRASRVVAVLGVGVILAVGAWNSSNVSQHVLINRDGGIYANAGRWIARTGAIDVNPAAGPLAGERGLGYADIGLLQSNKPIRLQFQGSHLLPALLAEAHAVGGDNGLFGFAPWLGAIALLEFFVLAWRLFRQPWFALAAMLVLASIVPEVSFSRDTYTEILTQVFLFAALALLVDRSAWPHWRVALGAGLLLGALQATHVDAVLILAGVPVVMLVAWLRAPTDIERRRVRTSNDALVVGLLPGCVLGFVDLMDHSRVYWESQWSRERALIALVALSAVGCFAIAKLRPRLERATARWPRDAIAWTVAAAVLVAGLGAWFVRPAFLPLHETVNAALQRNGYYMLRDTTLKYEGSMRWMSWYLGPLTLLAAIVGAALLARAIVRGRMLYALTPVVVFLPATLLYLWDANAFTDHIWVTRRYLTAAFPLLILLALGLAVALWRVHPPRPFSRTAHATAVVIAVGAVAFPVYTVLPVRSMREQGGYLAIVNDACHTIGHDAVVVVVNGPAMASPDVREEWMPQMLRSWCGATVATVNVGGTARETLLRVAARTRAENRRFFVVASGATPIAQTVPEANISHLRTVVNRRLLAQTFTHRPDRYDVQSFPMVVASLPALAGQHR